MSVAWLKVHDAEGADTLAVCFPPAGADDSAFAGWHGALPEGTALALVMPPGRGSRTDEPPVTDLARYADAVATGIRAVAAGRRLVLIGVGLGALAAYETCRRLLDAGVPVARLGAVAGRAPGDFHGAAVPEAPAGPGPEDVPPSPLHADLRLADSYDGRRSPALAVGLRAVWATGDARVPLAVARRWTGWSTGDRAAIGVEGGHDVHLECPAAVLSACLDDRPAGDRPADGSTPAPARGARPSRRAVLGAGATAVTGAVLSPAAEAAAAPRPSAAAAPAAEGRAGDSFDGDPTDPVALAVAMIRQNTSNPGDGAVTLPHARMLQGLFEAAGVPTEMVPTPKKDNVHFFARVPGSKPAGKKPLLFLGHSDVVPATGDTWTVEPFAGHIEDGRLYGRGALDMKGVNAAFVAALLRHVREGARFDRDIVFWSDCDEEQGPHGVRWFLDEHPDKVDPGVVLTEGGWLLNQRDGTTPMVATLTCNDRRFMPLRLETTSYATHTSKPFAGQAVIRLGRMLERLGEWRAHIRPNALSRRYFTELARATTDPVLAAAVRRMLDARTQAARDRAGEEVVRLSETPELHNAMLRTTAAFTATSAGYYVSIVPGTATADFRVAFLPGGGDDPGRVVAELRTLLGEGATLQVVGSPGETEQQTLDRARQYLSIPDSSTDTDVFRAWEEAVRQSHPGVRASACQFEAVTSAVPFRQRGIPVYGIYPFAVTRDMLKRMHGTDEHIGAAALRQGTETLYQLLARLRV
ncbi:M20/M25/M40 family metallo-hydrolase [Streptomyces sp. N2-109]|uniref:M20/M25/M40 family metallo-hydrolase n=1 Tax=Streptomyces gossypii TaxID=2883101 RepID=A0ABT2JUU1_9ACTN|nr:M20/M25/M40 family metallo-hydrolase [Streptomyces gossypii]MCT2591652.1 M20/M25/M40 family metallo-hydrolase [Streptomyces gossypii]